MTALIGFLGVIVGALVTGAVAYRVERRRLLDAARVAARLIGVELDAAIQALSAAESTGTRKPPKISTREWDDHGSDLVGFLNRTRPAVRIGPDADEQQAVQVEQLGRPDTGEVPMPPAPKRRLSETVSRYIGPAEEIATAYATIGLFNRGELPDQRGDGATLSETYGEGVRRFSKALDAVHAFLAETQPQSQWGRRAAVLIGGGLAIAAAVLVLIALSFSHTYETDGSVAASLAAAMPGAQAVQCSGLPGEAWQCTTVDVNASGGCGASFASHRHAQRALAASSCRANGGRKSFKVAKQGAKLIAAETARALFTEQGDVYRLSPEKRTGWRALFEHLGL